LGFFVFLRWFCDLSSEVGAQVCGGSASLRLLGLELPAALAHVKYAVWGLVVHPCPCRMDDVPDPWVGAVPAFAFLSAGEEDLQWQSLA